MFGKRNAQIEAMVDFSVDEWFCQKACNTVVGVEDLKRKVDSFFQLQRRLDSNAATSNSSFSSSQIKYLKSFASDTVF